VEGQLQLYNTLPHAATHCNTLQYTAPRCTALQQVLHEIGEMVLFVEGQLQLNCAARRPGSVPPLWQVYTYVFIMYLCMYLCVDECVYRVAKIHSMPYLHMSLSAKEPYS